MIENKKKRGLVETIRLLENSADAKEIRERLNSIAKRLQEAPQGADMKDILNDLKITMRVLDKTHNLEVLYGLQAKMLLEAAEFKRTGKHIIID